MNNFGTALILINVILLLLLPRRWAPLPLLVGVCYITRSQRIDIGPFTFTAIRILVAVGFIRILIRGELFQGKTNPLDKLMFVWAFWMLASSFFHEDPSKTLVSHLGVAYEGSGIYFLLRMFCQTIDDIKSLCRITAILLMPVALEMMYEKAMYHNLFFGLEGNPSDVVSIREGHNRARGPFAHPILAGTVGAVCLPLMVGIWRQHKKTSIAGILVCLTMVYACASSGPIVSAMAGTGALCMWKYRHKNLHLRFIGCFLIFSYIALDMIMNDPAYYLIARIDLVGGSTGWHRAKLIQTAISHLPEWWLSGTDYTRHWMPTGVSWSEAHTDITNHYLAQGVLGGLPLTLVFIAILYKGFSILTKAFRQKKDLAPDSRFMTWAIGASLFAHAVTCIGVSYYDQSSLFLYMALAVIGSIGSMNIQAQAKDGLAANKYF